MAVTDPLAGRSLVAEVPTYCYGYPHTLILPGSCKDARCSQLVIIGKVCTEALN